MPELPEVETIRRGLQSLAGRRIQKLKLNLKKIAQPATIVRDIQDKKVLTIDRRGKLLIITLEAEQHLLIHLKMTGQLVYRPNKNKMFVGGHPITNVTDVPNQFTHAEFHFDDDSVLYFNDVRRFGYIKLVNRPTVLKALASYGPEPLERSLTEKKWLSLIDSHPRWTVKKFLLDQATIAGIGNIYTDEACFYTGIKPSRLLGTLKPQQKKDLLKNLRYVLRLSLRYGGTSFNTYVQAQGHQGGFYKLLRVYGRTGEPCKKCGTPIQRIVIAGRGTHFCPRCQK